MRTHGHRRRQLHRLRGRGGFFSTVTTVLLVAMALLLSPCLAEAYSLMPQDNGIREGQTVTINTIGSDFDTWLKIWNWDLESDQYDYYDLLAANYSVTEGILSADGFDSVSVIVAAG